MRLHLTECWPCRRQFSLDWFFIYIIGFIFTFSSPVLASNCFTVYFFTVLLSACQPSVKNSDLNCTCTKGAIQRKFMSLSNIKRERQSLEIQGKDESYSEVVMGGLTYLLAAVESLTFLPSKEAKCCSRASRRLLGACRDRKHTVSMFQRCRKCSLYVHQDHKEQWWATKIERKHCTPWNTPHH